MAKPYMVNHEFTMHSYIYKYSCTENLLSVKWLLSERIKARSIEGGKRYIKWMADTDEIAI